MPRGGTKFKCGPVQIIQNEEYSKRWYRAGVHEEGSATGEGIDTFHTLPWKVEQLDLQLPSPSGHNAGVQCRCPAWYSARASYYPN
ncbi:hypothetical protein EVAR_46356_1 [Eumeta japonica]|uniref:Uncharacterized protein n=1 Tax=Eumeta variegata TaxID=151549 RepID=A0A4C1WVZ4_EUMVA|nr:hypothetical protein EVAR_46356_1 [Eumeta japonica]